MKRIFFKEEQLTRLIIALNSLTVTGMQQAEQLTICKQVLDSPEEIIEEEEGEKK